MFFFFFKKKKKPVSTSTAAVASSKTKTLDFLNNALPKQINCLCPTLKFSPPWIISWSSFFSSDST